MLSSNLPDLTVFASGKPFLCHRAVLAANSPVFEAMFSSSMKESHSGQLDLPDISPDIFAPVRTYMYGQPLVVREEIAIPLSVFVRRYEISIPELTDFLDGLLTSALTLDNVHTVRHHADGHNAHRLKRNCDRFITIRMNHLPEIESFLELPPQPAEAALRAPSNVSREAVSRKCAQYVLSAAVAWVAHDQSEREQHLETMLNAVDVDGLSLSALVRATRHKITLRSHTFQARLLRAFARRAERDLGFAPIPAYGGFPTASPSGFAIVDEPHGLRGASDDSVFPGVYPGALVHVRRRRTLTSSHVHHRFPRSQSPQFFAGRSGTSSGSSTEL